MLVLSLPANCWIYYLWNKLVLLQLSLARGVVLSLLPQLDKIHAHADNVSKEITWKYLGLCFARHFSKALQQDVPASAWQICAQCHKPHKVRLKLKCTCGLWSPQLLNEISKVEVILYLNSRTATLKVKLYVTAPLWKEQILWSRGRWMAISERAGKLVLQL